MAGPDHPQRDLLRKAFGADQAAEEHERQQARGRQADAKALWPESRPSDVWRWISPALARGRLRPRDDRPDHDSAGQQAKPDDSSTRDDHEPQS